MKSPTIKGIANKDLFPDARPLKILSVPGLVYFSLLYSPYFRPSFKGLRLLCEQNHPVYRATEQRYMKRNRNTLWWEISTSNQVISKKVVRAWCTRRLKNAFQEALKARGFDKNGRSIGQQAIATLRGSVELRVSRELVTAKYEDLQQQAAWAIEALLCVKPRSQNLVKDGGSSAT